MYCYGPTPRHNVWYYKTKALCPDGKVRTVTYTAYYDTFFSQPARTTVKVRETDRDYFYGWRTVTVSGFVSMGARDIGDEMVTFLQFTPTGKNKHLIPVNAESWDIPSEVIYAD